jgi:hypothetical protein
MFELPFVTDVLATVGDDSDELSIEMAGYPPRRCRQCNDLGARAIEAVDKGLVFALTCPTVEDVDSVWKEARELVSFGVYDPTAAGLGD